MRSDDTWSGAAYIGSSRHENGNPNCPALPYLTL